MSANTSDLVVGEFIEIKYRVPRPSAGDPTRLPIRKSPPSLACLGSEITNLGAFREDPDAALSDLVM